MALAGFATGDVFAEDQISISISDDSVVMNLLPGQYDGETQTITASTTSVGGIRLEFARLDQVALL